MTVLGTLVGTPIGILAGTYLSEYGAGSKLAFVDALHQRHPALGTLDRRRPLRLPDRGGADGPFLRAWRARFALAIIVDSRWWSAPPRTCCVWSPTPLREASAALGMPKSADRAAHRLQARHFAGLTTGVLLADVAHLRGDGTAALHRAQQFNYTSLEPANTQMASLPYVIYQYAGSAYRRLATARLVGRAASSPSAVLTLSISARTLGARTKR